MAGPIRISILADSSQAQRQLKSTQSALGRLSSRAASLRGPALVGLGAIAVGAKSAIGSASDLNEAVSKTGQIFGKQGAQIERFATNADKALGQSKKQALDAASTFGLIGQKAGLGGQESAKFAKRFTSLASDLASFNDTTPEEAITAIGAAMRGESEPIRKYGVLLDDATLRARALKEGLVESTKNALTPQQKALAASAEIMAQTGKAQGDFARTSDGAANKSRIVAAQTENLSASLGTSLLPAYQQVLGIASSFADLMAKYPTVTKVVIGVIAALAAVVLAVSAAQKVATTAQILLNVAMSANPIGLVVLAIAGLVAGFVVLYKKSDTFRGLIDGLFNNILKPLGTFIGGLLLGYVRTLAVAWLSMATFGVKAFRMLLTGAFKVFDGILSAAEKGLGWIPGLGGKIKTARVAFDTFGDATIDKLKDVENGLASATEKAKELGRDRDATITVRTNFVGGALDYANDLFGSTPTGEPPNQRRTAPPIRPTSPAPDQAPAERAPGRLGGLSNRRNGGTTINIGEVKAHDYADFRRQTHRQSLRANMDGVRRR